jgi:hypothetical protein
MPSTNWTLADDQTLAEYVNLEDFKSITQERIGISPDHVALLMRDGQIVDAFTGGHFAFGGIWQRMKEFIGGKHSFRLLVASLKPFMVEGAIEGLSKDNVPIAATTAVEFQLNPEKGVNILGLMKERDSLTKADIYTRLAPHLKDRVFSTIIRKVDATEIRGNTPLQDKIQAEVMIEVDRLFKDLGVMVRAVSLSWGANDEERAAIERSKSEREQRMLDFQAERTRRELTRDREIKDFTLRSDLEAEKLKASSEDELRHMFLTQELNFADAQKEGVRFQELKTLDHELSILNIQRANSYKKSLEDALNETERMAIRKKLKQIELEIGAMEEEQRIRLEKLKSDTDMDVADRARAAQIKAMRDIGAIEGENAKRDWEIGREKIVLEQEMSLKSKELDRLAEIERLRAQREMTPDQILATAAGLSPDVARVFSDRAKATGMDFEKREALLREMAQASKEGHLASIDQAKYFMDKAMQAVQGVAAGRSSAHHDEPAATASDSTVECPNCHQRIPITDRFCRICGHPMRA